MAGLLVGVAIGLLARELIVPIRGETGDGAKPDRSAPRRPGEGARLAPEMSAAYETRTGSGRIRSASRWTRSSMPAPI